MDAEDNGQGAGSSAQAGREEMAAKLGRLAGLHARAAARRAASFVSEHETEIRTAGVAAANLAASRVGHPVLRPVVRAAAAEFVRGVTSRDAAPPPREDGTV